MNFLQRTPFIRLLLSLAAGIVLSQFILPDRLWLWGSVFVSLFLIFISFRLKNSALYKSRWLFGFATSIIVFVIGIVLSQSRAKTSVFPIIENAEVYNVEITDFPVEKTNSFLCKATVIHLFADSTVSIVNKKVLLYFEKSERAAALNPGDLLDIQVKFQKPDGRLNPNGFDYAEYLGRQGIGATAYIADYKWKTSGKKDGFSPVYFAKHLQRKLLNVYRRFGIEGDEFAVLAALTLGSKDALHPELRQFYSTSGGMHILAVSGLHVGIIYFVLSLCLSFLNRKPALKAVSIVLLLWAYALITGLPASVVRSALMFSLVEMGRGFNRKAHIYNTISFSAFVMLLINPDFLFDVGFQLSYSAVVAIVYLQPKISKCFYIKNRFIRRVWDLTAVSLAAQAGTAPLAIYYFHQFPNYFLLTNLIAIPLASVIIHIAVLLFVIAVIPYLSVAIAFILNLLLKILNLSIEAINNLPFPLSVTAFNFWQIVLLYLTIIMFLAYLANRKFNFLAMASLFVLSFFTINIFVNFNTLRSAKFIVYAERENTHLDFIAGKNHYVATGDEAALRRVAESFWLNGKLAEYKPANGENWYSDEAITFGGKRILVLKNNDFDSRTLTDSSLKTDFLVVGNSVRFNAERLLQKIEPQLVIVDLTISDYYTNSLREQCSAKGIEFYSIKEKGAFVWNF